MPPLGDLALRFAGKDSILREGYHLMQYSVIGPGRAGRAFHDRLTARGFRTRLTRDAAELHGAEAVLLAVPDDAVVEVAQAAPEAAWLVLLSGSVPLSALGRSERALVLHPLQTIQPGGGSAALDGAPVCVTGIDPASEEFGLELAAALDLDAVRIAESARPLPHIACVFASNDLYALLHAAFSVFDRAGVGADDAARLLAPLLRRTVEDALAAPSALRPTGPVARGDVGTVRRHLAVLEHEAPELIDLYTACGRSLAGIVDPAAAARVAPLLPASQAPEAVA